MRFNVAALPALIAGLLLVIATALDSEPPHESKQAETLMDTPTVQATFNAYLPRFTADLEGDLSPVGDASGDRVQDFPAWEPAEIVDDVIGETQTLEPVRTPLPQIASVPQHCPAIIVETFGINAPAACRVARCESSWRVDAVGTAGEVGMFQVHPIHFPHLYATYGADADLSSPTINTAYAYSLSRGGTDWSHWSCRP